MDIEGGNKEILSGGDRIMTLKQISARVPESMRSEFYAKCDKEGQIYTVTLALILERFLDTEYGELWEEGEE